MLSRVLSLDNMLDKLSFAAPILSPVLSTRQDESQTHLFNLFPSLPPYRNSWMLTHLSFTLMLSRVLLRSKKTQGGEEVAPNPGWPLHLVRATLVPVEQGAEVRTSTSWAAQGCLALFFQAEIFIF